MIDEIAKLIVEHKNVVALTGAGISVESGIPPFRGKGGIWEKYNPEEYGHIFTFFSPSSGIPIGRGSCSKRCWMAR